MGYLIFKRGIDIAASAALLLLLLPVFLCVAALIRLESPGSPMFIQSRVGRGGRLFRMVKFRSMVKDAPSLGAWNTAQNDPRITRFGRFIRATSIDELPQLWNVFMGDMSLIGPRPAAIQQESLYTAQQWQQRHRVRPGITGLAQVSGRSRITPVQQIAFDVAYAAGPTLRTDMDILLRTVSQVAARKGTN